MGPRIKARRGCVGICFLYKPNLGWVVGERGVILKTITSGNRAPVFQSSNHVVAFEKTFFTYTASAIDLEGADVTFTFHNYPMWLSPSNSTISGEIPSGISETSFEVIASDTELQDTMRVKLTVLPDQFSLAQNYPNPFNAVTIIRYRIPRLSNVKLRIYDLLGQEVETLVSEQQLPGEYEIIWNGSGFASGLYFYRLETDFFSQARKLILQK